MWISHATQATSYMSVSDKLFGSFGCTYYEIYTEYIPLSQENYKIYYILIKLLSFLFFQIISIVEYFLFLSLFPPLLFLLQNNQRAERSIPRELTTRPVHPTTQRKYSRKMGRREGKER